MLSPLQSAASPKAWNSTGQRFKGSSTKEVALWLWAISSPFSHFRGPSGEIGLVTYASRGRGELALEEAVLVVFLMECLLHNWFPTLKSLLFHLGTWDLSGHTDMKSVFSGWEESAT